MKNNPYKDNPDYVTFAEAANMVGKSLTTFRKYADRMRICGIHVGRCTYYRRDKIETLRDILSFGAQELIAKLEAMTGGKVTITFEKNND